MIEYLLISIGSITALFAGAIIVNKLIGDYLQRHPKKEV